MGGQRWEYFSLGAAHAGRTRVAAVDHNNARISTVQVSCAFSLVVNKQAMVNMQAVGRVKIS